MSDNIENQLDDVQFMEARMEGLNFGTTQISEIPVRAAQPDYKKMLDPIEFYEFASESRPRRPQNTKNRYNNA